MKIWVTPDQHRTSSSLIIDDSHDKRPVAALVLPIQHRHVLLVQREAIHVSVEPYAARVVALGQADEPLLQAPPDEHLVGGDAVLLREADEVRVAGLLVADDGAVRLEEDAVGLAVGDDLLLLVPGVELRQERETRNRMSAFRIGERRRAQKKKGGESGGMGRGGRGGEQTGDG